MSEPDAPHALEQAIARYNNAWNAHDLDAIMAMHAPDMVFENHTAGEVAVGDEAREHIDKIFHTWPDIEFSTRRLYVRADMPSRAAAASSVIPDSRASRTGRSGSGGAPGGRGGGMRTSSSAAAQQT